jgi:hypothetical protein
VSKFTTKKGIVAHNSIDFFDSYFSFSKRYFSNFAPNLN